MVLVVLPGSIRRPCCSWTVGFQVQVRTEITDPCSGSSSTALAGSSRHVVCVLGSGFALLRRGQTQQQHFPASPACEPSEDQLCWGCLSAGPQGRAELAGASMGCSSVAVEPQSESLLQKAVMTHAKGGYDAREVKREAGPASPTRTKPCVSPAVLLRFEFVRTSHLETTSQGMSSRVFGH